MIIIFIFSLLTAHAQGPSQECMDIWMRTNRLNIMDRLERTYLRSPELSDLKQQIQSEIRGSCLKYLPEMVGTSFRDCKVNDVKACEAYLSKIHEESYDLYKKEFIDGAYFNKEVYRPIAPADFFEVLDRHPNVRFSVIHTVGTLNSMADYDYFSQKFCEIPWNCSYRLGTVRYTWDNFQLKNMCKLGTNDANGASQVDEAALKECEIAISQELYPKFLELAKSYGDKTLDPNELSAIAAAKRFLETKKTDPSAFKDTLNWEIKSLEDDLAYFERIKGTQDGFMFHHLPIISAALAAYKRLSSAAPEIGPKVEPAPPTLSTPQPSEHTVATETAPLKAATTQTLPMGASRLAYMDAEISNLTDFNCTRNPNFQVCKTYEGFKTDIVPSNITVLCGQTNCEETYHQLQTEIKQYFKSQIPNKVTEVGRKHPTVFISPLVASRLYNLNRTRNVTEKSVYMPFATKYISAKARHEGYQQKISERYKMELCKDDDQKKAGGDFTACLKFAEELFSSN